MVNNMVIMTFRLERSEEDNLWYLTEGTGISGFDVIDGSIYTPDGVKVGVIIRGGHTNNLMEIEVDIKDWALQRHESQ